MVPLDRLETLLVRLLKIRELVTSPEF